MSRTLSPSSNKPYGVARVTAVWEMARSSYYAGRKRQQEPRIPLKRGPKRLSDEELVGEILQVLEQSVFHGEGYRKVWARLRHNKVRAWKDRVLRVMREHGLLSPSRAAVVKPENPHSGTIIVDRPDQLWGTDGTATFTQQDGQVTIFAAIDHCTAECLGIHAVKKAHRFEALEPIRQAVREQFGSFSAGAAARVRLRHDHGSVYMSEDFQNEVRSLAWNPHRPTSASQKETGASSDSSAPSKNSCSGLRPLATSRNFVRRLPNSATATTITGLLSG